MESSDQVKSYKLAWRTYNMLSFAHKSKYVTFLSIESIPFNVLISVGLNKYLLIKYECMDGCSFGISCFQGRN